MLEREVYLITFHSRTLYAAKLNYDVYNKELLVIFEAFKKWYYYLEGVVIPIDIVTNHKNIEYFSTTKSLTRY